MKGVNSIEKIPPLLVISYQLSVVSGGGSLEVVRKNSGRRLAVRYRAYKVSLREEIHVDVGVFLSTSSYFY